MPFQPPPFDDPATDRLARSLHFILLAGMAASFFYLVVLLLAPTSGSKLYPLISIFAHLLLLRLLRTSWVSTVGRGYVALAWLTLAYGTFQDGGIVSPSFFGFISVILISGLLFNLRVSLALAGLTALVGLGTYTLESQGRLPPNPYAADSPEVLIVLILNLFIAAVVISLATRQLRIALDETRTSHMAARERAVGLAAAADVGRAAASFHSLDELLPTVTKLISERFGFYHVCIYLLDDSKDRIVLRAAHGPAGRQMLAGGHAYRVGDHGIISQVAVSAKAYVAMDTQTDPLYRPNPLLPNTRSEIGLPLQAGDTQYGVLDVQSTLPNAFQEEAITVLSVLADQVAIGVQNAYLLDEAAARNRLLASLARVGSALASMLDLQALLDTICHESIQIFEVHSAFVWLVEGSEVVGAAAHGQGRADFLNLRLPLDDPRTLGPRVIREGRPIIVNDAQSSDQVNPELIRVFGAEAILGVPLSRGQHSIGAVMLLDQTHKRRFDQADVDAAVLFASQISTAIENARLFQATRRRLDELTVLHGISLAGLEAVDEDELIRRTTTLIGGSLYPNNFGLLLFDADRQALMHHPSYWEGEHRSPPIPPLRQGICWEVARTGKSLRLGNVRQFPDYVEVDPLTNSELCVPLWVGGQILGVINTENHRPSAFSEDDERLLLTVAAQLGTVLDKLRLTKEEERRSAELRGLYEIAEAFKTMTNVEETYGSLAERLANLIGAGVCIVALHDPITGYLVAQQPGHGVNNEVLAKARYPAADAGQIWNFRRQGVFRANELRDIPELFAGLVRTLDVRNVLVAPMLREERFLGAVFALNKPGGFTDDDSRLLSVFASQAGAVIENTRLYADAQERARDLAKSLTKQEELDRLKSEFVQNVSHELRTPLAIIKGYIELLDSGELGSMPADYAEPVSIIRRRVDMLNKMISDLTALLETQNVGLRTQMVDIRTLAEAQLADFSVVAEKARLNLKQQISPDLPPISGDPEMLRRIFDNLLGNALKFTPVRGTITVRLYLQGEEIILEVADTGSGIPENEQARIFERFYQVDGSSTRKHGGTGLGLALVKEITEKHGGQVGVKSRVNMGSTFRVTLPVAPDSHTLRPA
ncbi:MAG: GAF domain-containing protein [Chloroflexi bacterium]|nr:GAF domain-containing protein [Chloroflexota bacterium]